MNKNLNIYAFCAVILVLLFTSINFVNQMYRADHKEFWNDESFSLKNTVQAKSYIGLIAKAANNTEANPAPLDYLFTKLLDDLKPVVNSFGLSDEIYYRLWANFIMSFCGLFVVFLFLPEILNSKYNTSIKLLQLLLLCFIPFAYLPRPMVYHYAAEVRPYALWFSLWFMSVAVCFCQRPHKRLLIVLLSALAMTMVGSVFQIAAIGLAFLIVNGWQKGWKQAFLESLQIFSLPTALVLFYALGNSYDYPLESVAIEAGRFWKLWNHEATIIPMMIAALLFSCLNKEARLQALGPLSVLIMFALGPVIFMITKYKGYFFTERQYIYYDAHRTFFILSLIAFLPYYLDKIKGKGKQIVAIILVLTLCYPIVFSKKHVNRYKEMLHNTKIFHKNLFFAEK